MAGEENALPLTWKDLKEKIATRGDLATVLIAAPVGYGVDLLLSLTGVISPGTFGFLAACGALGAKQAVQSSAERKRAILALPPPRPISVREKAENAIKLLNSNGHDAESKKVKRALELFENSLLTEIGLQQCIDDAVQTYQKSGPSSRPGLT
jgi:hypothetical protein